MPAGAGRCRVRADLPIACEPQDEQRVYVTPTAGAQLDPDTAWYLLGGLDEEGDTYDTQAEFFRSAWERFWTQIAGPDEAARVAIFAAISKHFGDAWQFVIATRRGRKVFVQVDENQSRELRPNAVRRR